LINQAEVDANEADPAPNNNIVQNTTQVMSIIYLPLVVMLR